MAGQPGVGAGSAPSQAAGGGAAGDPALARTVADPRPQLSALALQQLAAQAEAQALLDLLPALPGLRAAAAPDRPGMLSLAPEAAARPLAEAPARAALAEGVVRLLAWLPPGVRLTFVERMRDARSERGREVEIQRQGAALLERETPLTAAPWSPVTPEALAARIAAGLAEDLRTGAFLTALRLGASKVAGAAGAAAGSPWSPMRVGLLIVAALLVLAAALFAPR